LNRFKYPFAFAARELLDPFFDDGVIFD